MKTSSAKEQLITLKNIKKCVEKVIYENVVLHQL